jgi:hypothetical protein
MDIARRKDPYKERLPHPYNLDLSRVLRGLNRLTPYGRRKAANDCVTASYLNAAMRLIQRQLGPGRSRISADAEDPDAIVRPLLSFLSQSAVSREVRHNPPPFHGVGKPSTLRNRWKHQSDFIGDVLRFGLWAWHFPAPGSNEMTAEILHGPDPVLAIHRLCYWDVKRHVDSPMFRLSLVAAAEAEGDTVVCEAIQERNRSNGALWKDFYHEFLAARGLRMRPGVTIEDCVALMSAIADGLALRTLADPAAHIVDDSQQRCLLGKAALAVIAGCLEPAGEDHPQSLEQAAAALLDAR